MTKEKRMERQMLKIMLGKQWPGLTKSASRKKARDLSDDLIAKAARAGVDLCIKKLSPDCSDEERRAAYCRIMICHEWEFWFPVLDRTCKQLSLDELALYYKVRRKAWEMVTV